jgi:chemosensory pili system protein ChpC
MSHAVDEEFYGLLVPLADERLIVPRSCTAEVVAWTAPAPMVGAPPWYVGTVAWNSRVIPVISFEAALGRPVPQASGRTRIVVLYALGDRLAAGHFGILTQGFPQLIRLNQDLVKPDPTRDFPDRSPVMCALRMLNENPLIPDFEYLEDMIADETSVAAES